MIISSVKTKNQQPQNENSNFNKAPDHKINPAKSSIFLYIIIKMPRGSDREILVKMTIKCRKYPEVAGLH